MTVGELVEELSNLPPDMRVFTTGYEGGYTDLSGVSNIREFALDVNTAWYYGPHEEVDFCEKGKYPDKEIVSGVVVV